MNTLRLALVLTMFAATACEENMNSATDSATESDSTLLNSTDSDACTVYLAPGDTDTTGNGSSAEAPVTNADDALDKAETLEARCGDNVEVRILEGSASDAQIASTEGALTDAGYRVTRTNGSASTSSTNTSGSVTVDSPSGVNDVNSGSNVFNQASAVPLAYTNDSFYSINQSTTATTIDPYLVLNESGSILDWRLTNNNGTFNIAGATSPAEPVITNYLTMTTVDSTFSKPVKIWGTDVSSAATGGIRIYTGTNTTTPLAMDSNEIDSYESVGIWLNNNSKKQVSVVGPSATWPGTSTGTSATAPTAALQVSNASYLDDFSIGSRTFLLLGTQHIDAYNRNKTTTVPLAYTKKELFLQKYSGGNVAIGNLTAAQVTHRLTVDGGIKAEEIVVDAVGADFVFEENYNLMCIDEVEKFVEENNHLPGIASAADMQQNGVSMGEFQIQLLQKIEELTLYMIEQNKRIKAQEDRIGELEQKHERPL